MKLISSKDHRLHATDQALVGGRVIETSEVPHRAEVLHTGLLAAKLGDWTAPVDHGLQPLMAVHAAEYLHFLRTIYTRSAEKTGLAAPVFPSTFATRAVRRKSKNLEALPGYYSFGTGTPILEGTWQAAYASAQTALTACDMLLQGEQAAYALCRPPGHHASTDLYGGYCYLNNAAIAARYLLAHSAGPEARLAILDIDYHHGNGTQEIFYHDGQVFYCSLHADPDLDYPYFWGSSGETGFGSGTGLNRNWPLPLGVNDGEYLAVLDQALEQVAKYSPHWLVLSAGLDIGEGDPEGGFRISLQGFEKIGERIAGLHLPTVIIQEGGYRLDQLAGWAAALLRPFAG